VPDPLRVRRGRVGRQLERVERDAGVTVRDDHERAERVGRDGHGSVQPARIGDRPLDDQPDVILTKRLQHEDPGTREERRDDLERRVLGRRADERDIALLDVRQHRVLLTLVEAVDLVDEQDGALAGGAAQLASLLDHATQIGDPGRDRGEGDESGLPAIRRDGGERRLPSAGWSPEDHRRDLPCVDGLAQDPARADQVGLTDELVEVARTDACRQWLRERLTGGGGHLGREQGRDSGRTLRPARMWHLPSMAGARRPPLPHPPGPAVR